jgi:uncharacterized membrane protein
VLTVLFASISSFIDQLGSAVSKDVMDPAAANLDVWTSALLSLLFGSLIIFMVFLFKVGLGGVILDTGYIWTFIPRVALEILQLYVTYTALKISDLSTFGFIRVISIIVVVISELVFMGVLLKPGQYLGIFIVLLSILAIFRSGKSKTDGWKYSLASAVNGALLLTFTRFQFNHINPYLNESIVRAFCIVIVLGIILISGKGLAVLPKKILWLAPFRSLTGLLNLLALNFGSASIYSTSERGGSVVSAVLVGHSYFKEKSFGEKLLISLSICFGIILLLT